MKNMLTKWTEQEFDQYAPWAYGLAMSSEHASYPTYQDGIKTWKDFISRSQRPKEDEEGLLFRHDGQVHGWVEWYIIPGENYANTMTFLTDGYETETVAEFTRRVQARLPGGVLDIGMDERNENACRALEQAGYRCIERAVNHTLFFRDYQPKPAPDGVSLMTDEDEGDFRRLHDYPEMYWNADRVLADRANWNIYLQRENGRAVGALVCTAGEWPEIFSIDFENHQFNPYVYRRLMTACLNDLKSAGASHMTYFEEEDRALPILAELGFVQVGGYRAYRKNL